VTSRVLFEFGPFTLDPLKRVLMRQGQSVPVPPRAVDVLLALIARRGTLVSKDELLRTVWDDTVVEENNLSVSISALRKALGETTRDHRYIVTLPRRGYSFVAAVSERPADQSSRESAPAAARQRSHALVIPFDVIVGDRTAAVLQPFTQAIADGVAAHLGNSQHVAIITGTREARSARPEPALVALARRCGADYVLLGSLRFDRKRVRVMSRLLRTSDATTVWGLSFEDADDDLFAAEGRIVDRLAHAITAHFEEELHQRSARRSAERAEAHRDYVRGR